MLKFLRKGAPKLDQLAAREARHLHSREHQPFGETALRHAFQLACLLPRSKQCRNYTCHIVRQVKYAGALPHKPGGDAMVYHLADSRSVNAAHLVDPFVVPEAENAERHQRQALRLESVQKNSKRPTCVYLSPCSRSGNIEEQKKQFEALRPPCKPF